MMLHGLRTPHISFIQEGSGISGQRHGGYALFAWRSILMHFPVSVNVPVEIRLDMTLACTAFLALQVYISQSFWLSKHWGGSVHLNTPMTEDF